MATLVVSRTALRAPSMLLLQRTFAVTALPRGAAATVADAKSTGTTGGAEHSTATSNAEESNGLTHFAFKQGKHPLDPIVEEKKMDLQIPARKNYLLYQPAYTEAELHAVKYTHYEPSKFDDRLALAAIRLVRRGFDTFTGYGFLNFNEKMWLRRIIFLETVAGVPGMVGGMCRHLRSLRRMQRDHGWIHTLLGEAENERMHLLTFLTLKQPGMLFRGMVLLGQGIFFNAFLAAYLVYPRACHRFVGYLEEEAVKTYTHCLADLKAGKLPIWAETPAPVIAKQYWHLKDDAMMYDVLMAVRADEANHRDVNHTFSSLKADDSNPFD